MFELEFFGPVNKVQIMSSWSINLSTIFYWAGLVLYMTCNWQLPFFNQRKEGNDHRNNFKINLHESNAVELGFDLAIPGSAVRRTGDISVFTYIVQFVPSRKTCLYNFDPLKPHFYIVKLGFTGVYIIFLISAQKHRLWVLVRTASARRL